MWTVQLRADRLLADNLRSLLNTRRIDHGALAMWCGHKAPWISKILSGERGLQVKELGKVADFFGLTVAELFQFGISVERRRRTRRERERRAGLERRKPEAQQR